MSLILKRVLTRKDCLTETVTKGIPGAFSLLLLVVKFSFEKQIKDYETNFKYRRSRYKKEYKYLNKRYISVCDIYRYIHIIS